MPQIQYLPQLRELLEQARSIRSAAKSIGRDESTVRSTMRRHGVVARPFRLTAEVRRDLQFLLEKGHLSHRQIAIRLGIVHDTVNREARRRRTCERDDRQPWLWQD
jgi:IS30 family transposase